LPEGRIGARPMNPLRIDVRELERRPSSLEAGLTARQLNLDEAQVRISGEVAVRLTAERQSRGGVRVQGELGAEMELTCARCLEALSRPMTAHFNQYYQSNAHHSLTGEIALQEKDLEVGFFTGDFIDVSDIVREQILLSLPMKPLCQEDCRGLCPACGRNRNRDGCRCGPVVSDPRLAPLLKFRN